MELNTKGRMELFVISRFWFCILQSLSDQIQEYNSVKERLSEQQELIADLEARLKERNDTLQHDKHKYVSEIKHLRNEVSCKEDIMVYTV